MKEIFSKDFSLLRAKWVNSANLFGAISLAVMHKSVNSHQSETGGFLKLTGVAA